MILNIEQPSGAFGVLLLLHLDPLPQTRSMKHMHTSRHADLAIVECLVTYRTVFGHCSLNVNIDIDIDEYITCF